MSSSGITNLPDNITHRVSDNLLDPISIDPPPSVFEFREHTVEPKNVDASHVKGRPVQTNKFYSNMLLEGENNPIWPLPYGLRWERGRIRGFMGLSVSHVDDDKKVFGPDPNARPVRFYFSSYISDLIFSATKLGKDHQMTLTQMSEFHTNINLFPSGGSTDGPHMTIFVSRGMSFITAEYANLTPVFNSEFDFKRVDPPRKMTSGWIKYEILLEGDVKWLLYASDASLKLKVQPTHRLEATGAAYTGIVQVAKVPRDNPHAEKVYDENFGTWPMGADLEVTGDGVYTFKWKFGGDPSKSLLLFSLPHHRESFFPTPQSTDLQLSTTTRGLAKAHLGNTWTFREPELPDVEFLPKDFETKLTPEKTKVILEQARKDYAVDFVAETTTDSIYFSGKGLAKMGLVCLVLNKLPGEEQGLGRECIMKLKRVMDIYAQNLQQVRLTYETTWKGVVSMDGFIKGPETDFGNTWYNDHHYHYGYLIFAASILCHLDESWGAANDPWISALVRDVANPSPADPHFPAFRAFDWYVGHSWSKGIFPSIDGKDEESTSEDVNFYYAMKLYGLTSKREKVTNLANMMLAILRRSIRNYFLMEDDNRNHPPQFVKNKVTGILFENKVDYTTYFSTNVVTNSLTGSWKSILYANYAQVNAEEAYQFFLDHPGAPLDDGLSRTWALFWSAIGGDER
ncbi:11266_t:CDS:2 [Acaulospora colombiana]|uniref:11266_t:CDS:1 n=1 Tax=Acaulospora colombiana TaxID=27376 RepID=A0ACA9KY14_9GLOM|nr:11266_t:CDS:2 [Acaulospora colombiana]